MLQTGYDLICHGRQNCADKLMHRGIGINRYSEVGGGYNKHQ